MDNICSHCQELLSHSALRPHAKLTLMSSLPNSQLYKCNACHSYLHAFDQEWEVLLAGGGEEPSSVSEASGYL